MTTQKVKGYWQIKENVVREARKYSTRSDFAKAQNHAYTVALKKFPEAFEHMKYQCTPAGFWNDKSKVLDDAKKYKSIKEWMRGRNNAYASAKRNNWFNEATAHMVKTRAAFNTWSNKENVLAEALKYQSRSEWGKKGAGSYLSALEHGWIEEASAHMSSSRKPNNYWDDKENVAKESRKYSSRYEWCRYGGSSYLGAKKNGWLDELIPSQTRSLGSWTKEELQLEANKFNTRTAFSDGALPAYRAACKLKIMDEICKHMTGTPKGYWRNLENLKEDSAKYSNKTDWITANPAAYEAAKDMEVVDECCEHMIVYRLPQNTWTKELILLEARKFDKRNDWKHSPGGSYGAACEMGVLVEACAHMERLRTATDCVYLLNAVGTNFNGKPVFKCGVSSEVNLTKRIKGVCWDSGLECELVEWAYTGEGNAKHIERKLLGIGDDPDIYSNAGKKLTEFRAYDGQEYTCAIEIITQAKIDK